MKFQKKAGPGGGGRVRREGQGMCEKRSEVFVIFFGGVEFGGGGGGGSVGGGVRMYVNEN